MVRSNGWVAVGHVRFLNYRYRYTVQQQCIYMCRAKWPEMIIWMRQPFLIYIGESQIWTNMDVIPLHQLVSEFGTPLLVLLGLSLIMFMLIERMNMNEWSQTHQIIHVLATEKKHSELEHLYDFICLFLIFLLNGCWQHFGDQDEVKTKITH